MILWDKNPFLVREDNGQEVPTTRLTISDIPLSYSNDDIVKALEAIGCRLMSRLIFECDRDDNKRLTRWKTGRRFVYIALPETPLVRSLKIGLFEAKLYHREQKLTKQTLECYKCLQPGHISVNCQNPIRCRVCRLENHRAGDKECRLVATEREAHLLEEGEVRDDEGAHGPAVGVGQTGVHNSHVDGVQEAAADDSTLAPLHTGSMKVAATPPTTKKPGPLAKWMINRGSSRTGKDKRDPPSPEDKPNVKAPKVGSSSKPASQNIKDKMDAT